MYPVMIASVNKYSGTFTTRFICITFVTYLRFAVIPLDTECAIIVHNNTVHLRAVNT